MPTTLNGFRSLLSESHRRQFNGEDWQQVAVELARRTDDITFESDKYTELCSSPDPGCDCGFCATAFPEQ